MNSQDEIKTTQAKKNIRRSSITTVVCDAVLLLVFVACLLGYISRNNVNSYNQNIENITSIATANSQLMQSALRNMSYEINMAYNYCNGKSPEEILDYLSLINDSETEYQLLKRDDEQSTPLYHIYSGYSTKKADGEYQRVAYEDTSLSLSIYQYASNEDGRVSYSQSFTNATDALRYFAVFCGLSADDGDGPERYFLVKPQKESAVLDHAQTFTQYQDLAVAICYTDGKYLAHDGDFRGDNFYNYLYKYNGLSLDEKNAVRSLVQSDDDGIGVLTYKDYQKRDCAFAYAECDDSENWLVIVSVPVSEFIVEKLLSFFPLIIIIFLVILLVFNIYRLLAIVRALRLSVEREQIANLSKSSFLSRMSHEIRTPLNAVIGYNTIAQSEMRGAHDEAERKQTEMKVMDCLTKSEIASKHLLSIINDVLDMSAIEGGKIKIANERFDFKGLITSLTTVFYSQARAKGVTFDVVFDTLTEEWFSGDQLRTNQILTNLLSNAIKFTPEGGSVTMKITQPEAEANSPHIHFEITDTGIGMTPEYLSHIWTPFEQADSSISRRFGGTGLGLSITKNLVDLMGGAISVASEPGVGTTFTVDLTFERAARQRDARASDFSSVNALVVDDDAGTCDYIRLLFNRFGAKCACVTSGADAVKAVSKALEKGEPYSLCLIDWRMPQMDGVETAERIRGLAGDKLPIIVLSAYDYTELADKAVSAGISKFISKPLFQSALFDLLATVGSAAPSVKQSNSKGFNFAGARVLLAEDNVMNMEIAKTLMEASGLVVDSAWNGREAVDAFEASAPGFYTAILMDVHMPEMNGHEATRAIRASSHPEAKTIPIIAMTADAFAENVAESLASGMNDHISKPINVLTLFTTLKKYI